MIHTLKKYYPSIRHLPANATDTPKNFAWFQTEQGEVIGIHKSELVEKDIALLSSFLSKYEVNLPALTVREQLWQSRIHNVEYNEQEEISFNYRLIYFQTEQGQIEPIVLKTTLQEFYTGPISIIWHNDFCGILIEEDTSRLEETLTYEQIADTIMSELYVKTAFYVGPYLNKLKDVSPYAKTLTEQAPSSFQYHDSSVVYYIQDYPFHVIEHLEPYKREQLSSWILKEFSADVDALQTIRTFIECNLNLSETSKKLYMHRNSVQYRLDKFLESTGIDVKQFEQAITVYLAILANMHEKS